MRTLLEYKLKHPLTLVMTFGFTLTALRDNLVFVTSRVLYTYLILSLAPSRNVFPKIH